MNRIVLIGNGFDLAHAHGLKTSYGDFMSNHWKEFVPKFLKSSSKVPYVDEFIKIEFINGPKDILDAYNGVHYGNEDIGVAKCRAYLDFIKKINNVSSYIDLKKLIAEAKESSGLIIELTFENDFWGHICETSCLKNWVDIEREYFRKLKKIYAEEWDLTVSMLNEELESIKNQLVEYLSKIQKEKITNDIVNEQIKAKTLLPFDERDISLSGYNMFSQYLIKYEDSARNIVTDPLYPQDTLFLNFNYTKTAGLYIPQEDENDSWQHEFRLNHIHGELDNDENPIIFGYGDEIDETYKKILDLDDNDYLKNIKSIRYLETDNYRKLLSYIDSAPYQIYIMGHSCGNSDRTLLNTLFEHKNCVSIKPFYYKRPDGTDDYIDIVQNISRNFKDATLMRDRVVNKTYCEPLPQNE